MCVCVCVCVCVCTQSLWSCPTLYNPMDCSPPDSSVLGWELKARETLPRMSEPRPQPYTCHTWVKLSDSPNLFSFQGTGCTEHICMGSIMLPSQQIRKPEDVRTKEQLFPLAKEFIDQYYSSIKRQVRVYTGEPQYWVQRLQVQLCRQLNQD